MARPLTDRMATALHERRPLALLAEIEHPSGTARFWTGVGSIVWDGNTFTGAGHLASIGPVHRTSDLAIQEITFSLAGVTPEQAAELEDDVRNLSGMAWLACLGEHGEIIPDPYQLIDAQLDYQSFNVDEDGTSVLSITAHTGFYTLERALDEAWTPEDQKQTYPTDVGLDMVPLLQNQDIQWTPT